MKKHLLMAFVFLVAGLFAQEAFDGYTLYNQNSSHYAYLLDMDGETAHSWYSSYNGGYSCYLLEDGTLLRPMEASNTQLQGTASSGRFCKFDWDGNAVWQFDYHGSSYLPHHDIEPMPNGNILAIVWEVKSATECVNNGLDSYSSLWPDYIVEIEPVGTNSGNIIWEWHFWDHLIQDHDSSKLNYGVVADHPELLDINLGGSSGGPGGGGGDWLHINGIDYNEELDQIVITSHNLDELYVIDHSTTTEEAAGHTGGNSGMGGDILYRWGNAGNYGANASYEFNIVHCGHWIAEGCPGEGNLMAFNNEASNNQSQVIEIELPYENTYNYSWTPGTAFAPETPVWEYSNGTTFYSNHLGSVQRLPNGNTLISESTSGYLFEVDSDGNVVWDKDTTGEVPRCLRYATDYSGLSELFPQGMISGVVYNSVTNEAVSGALISAGNQEVETDEDGYFEMSIAAGIYEVTCSHSDFEEYIHPEDVEVEEDEIVVLEIPLTPISQNGVISGEITDETTGEGISGVLVTLGEYSITTDDMGLFSIEIPADVYSLVCSHNDYENYIHNEEIDLVAGIEINLDIVMIPVLDSDNDQITPATVLKNNYPNPFNPETTISFYLSDSSAKTELCIYDLKGKKLLTLISDNLSAGEHSVTWDGKDSTGKNVSSGIYLYRLTQGNFISTKKMILMK